jgi:hypothetical protein
VIVSKVCALVLAVWLAVTPALSHACDVGCQVDAAAQAMVSVPAEAEDCPLHDADAETTSSPHHGSREDSSSHSAPCGHDGHDQALNTDVSKVARLTTLTAGGDAVSVFALILAPSSISTPLRTERADRAASAATTRPVLRI